MTIADYSGTLLERWCLKVAINLGMSGWDRGVKSEKPPAELVEIAFGRRRFTGGAGLYIPRYTHFDSAVDVDNCKWDLLTNASDGKTVVGFAISLRYLLMVVSFKDGTTAAALERLLKPLGRVHAFDTATLSLAHRPRSLSLGADDKKLDLRLTWE